MKKFFSIYIVYLLTMSITSLPANGINKNVIDGTNYLYKSFTSLFPQDKLIDIEKATLTRGNTYGNEAVDLTFDKTHRSIYSSSRTNLGDSVIIDYTLKGSPSIINFLQLVQRQDGNTSSHFEGGSIWYQLDKSSKWKLVKTFKVNRGSNFSTDVIIKKPAKIRICLKKLSEGGAVALAEAEFYELKDRGDCEKDARFFEDEVFSKLKSTTTKKDLKQINSPIIKFLAEKLLEKNYSNEFRVRTYQGQRTPWVASSELKIGSQSHYDNPTGIFFAANEKYAVYLGKGAGATVNLRITDFRKNGGSQSVILKEGINIFTSKVSGTGFIQYYTDSKTALPDINIHFIFGHEVGFWDTEQGNTNADWKRLLSMAEQCYKKFNHTDGFFSTCGKYSQLLNTVDAFKTWCPNDIERLMVRHDSILLLSYDLMGLSKHNAIPKNRKLNLRTWGGPPHWNGSCANYPNAGDYMLDADNIGWWVFAHELGHGNQIRHHMHMTGWGECSNNVYSVYVNYMMGTKNNIKLEHEACIRKQSDNEPSTIGGRINSYLNEAHIVHEPYLTQEGQDYVKGSSHDGGLRGDHFVKLVPLWQLTLYFMIIGEEADSYRPDFWADINWAAIQDDRDNLSNGERYVNFMRRSIKAANCDLTKFFTDMGLLRVIDRKIDDYSSGYVTITQKDVDDLTAYGRQFPNPTSPVISYISYNSLNAFKNKVEVEGEHNQGVSDYTNGNRKGKKVEHNSWKNVVVFETYAGEELIDIAMVGTGDVNNRWTYARYPSNATRIEAVSYSGKRTLVFGSR